MDYFRVHLGPCDGHTMAPNGEDTSIYGPRGDPVPQAFIAADDENLDSVELFLVGKLMNPFLEYVRAPIVRRWKDVTGCEEGPGHQNVTPNVVGYSVISGIARIVVSSMATLSLAAAIAVLDKINDPNARKAVMTIIGLGFAASVHFIGPNSIPTYHLITA